MIDLVTVCKYDMRNRNRVRFHTLGKYAADYPYTPALWYDGRFTPTKPFEDGKSYNNGSHFTKCGILAVRNPFGIGPANHSVEYYIPIRRDHAEKFADACKRCFRDRVTT